MKKVTCLILLTSLMLSCKKNSDSNFPTTDLPFNKVFTIKSYSYAQTVDKTSDGGYFVAGYTDDFEIGDQFEEDAWVMKLDKNGNKLWQKVFSWVAEDEFYSVAATPDGGCIVAGSTYTTNGGVEPTHGMYNRSDAWVVKLDKSGNVEWDIIYGGSLSEEANSIKSTSDGGYIMAGWAQSDDMDVSGQHGGIDAWIVKLNGSGAIQWQRALGGSEFDNANSITETPDGGYVMAGWTRSNNGDVSGYHGASGDQSQYAIAHGDAWIVKLDQSGNKLWQRTLGGSLDDAAYAIAVGPGGGCLVAGGTTSNDGDVGGSNHHSVGVADGWVVKLDESGNILWQRTLGGTAEDVLNAMVVKTDGSCVVAGHTWSNDGDVSGNHSEFPDLWCVKLDKAGQMLWQKTLGGSYYDYGYAITETLNGNYVLSGMTMSKDGDLTGVHNTGHEDAWVLTLKDQ